MQVNYQQETLLDMPNRRMTSMVYPPPTSLPTGSDAEAIAHAVWLTSASEAPLPEAWSVPDLSHHLEGFTGEYHSDLIDPTSHTGLPMLQWMQHRNNTIPTSLADASHEAAIFNANLSTTTIAADQGLLIPTTSSSTIVPPYYPVNIASGSNDYVLSSSSSHNALIPVPATTALLDLTNRYLLSPSPITTTPLAYPAATTATDHYQSLSTATIAASSLENNQSSTMFAAPQSLLPGYLDAPYGIANQYVLKTQGGPDSKHPIDEVQDYVGESSAPSRSTQQDIPLPNTKKLSKTSAGSTNKSAIGKKKAKDSISLLPKSARSGLVNRQTSCWRCRRYKKPCTGKGSVCDACVTSGFRIWSSEIGCRKGGMDEFVLMLIPSEADSHPIIINTPYTKPPSFRQSAHMFPSGTVLPLSAAKGDVWEQFLYKIQSTGIHGPGVLELVQIAIDFQRKLDKPDKVIVSAARAMSAAADMFRIFVSTEDSKTFHTATNITSLLWETRKVMVAAAAQFLRNCLTGRIKQWFPTFMASNMNVFAYILIGDAIAAIPAEFRNVIWPNVRKTLLDLRSVLYPTARDLMNALSKGSQPLNMSCWGMVPDENGEGMIRNPDGMQLVDDCEITFDGIHQLQQWRERFLHILYGDSWMSTRPLEVDLLLITSVSRLFITPKA